MKAAEAFATLEQSVQAALETYSNVHRGSGHNSLVSTYLYEQAREIVLEHLGLDKDQYTVIFCSPRRAELLKAQLKSKSYQIVSSQDIGLPLGVRALAVERKALPGDAPFQVGGGTARLVFPNRVIWAKAPDKFEAGTPAIVNVIAFVRALQLTRQFGKDAFRGGDAEKRTAAEILYHDELAQYSGRELLDELRQTLIGRGLRVPTLEGNRPYINLDNAASTPTFTPIWEAVCQAWRQPRQVQREIVQETKSICANMLGAPLADYDVIFTSNTTEAINLAAESLGRESKPDIQPVVVNTILEHNSNELPWRKLTGASLIRLPVDAEGFVELKELELLLRAYNEQYTYGKKRIKLVALSGASNVLGVCNNLAEISQIVHRYGVRLLVDAAQLVAHRKVSVAACGIDYLAFSAHKAYAPFGTGVLMARKGMLTFSPAELAQIQASGDENVGGIAALGKALVLLQRIGLDLIQQEEQALTEKALRGLAQIPGLTVYGLTPDSPRFAHKGGVIVFRLEGLMANRIARELAEQGGIGVRYGCHCAHLLIKNLLHIPPWQELLQGVIVSVFPQVSLPGLTRISLGIQNSTQEIDTLLHVLEKIARQPRLEADNPFASTQTDIQRQMDNFAQAAAQKVYTQLK
jgi:selenocysteine lyase/cysteine desulfurase